jgi:hypothetical protein
LSRATFSKKARRCSISFEEISGISDAELSDFALGASQADAEKGLGADGMNGMVQCGQGLVPIKEIKTAKQIVEDTVKEAEELLLNASKRVQQC